MRGLVLAVVCAFAACALTACARGGDAPGAGPRIVSLTPSATDLVAALGAAPALVGVDDFSRFPPEVDKLPRVGSFLQPNVEAIVRLHPTLVIVDDIHATTAHALASANVPTVECPMHALADVRTGLRTVGDRLGRAREAATAIAAIDGAIAAARARPPHHLRVLAVIDRAAGSLGNAIAAGDGSWIDELLKILGADNVIAGAAQRYPPISLETITRSSPDVILDLSGQDPSAWNDLDVPAVKNHHVIALSEPTLQGPTPRVVRALEVLARALP